LELYKSDFIQTHCRYKYTLPWFTYVAHEHPKALIEVVLTSVMSNHLTRYYPFWV